ncbi:MAG: tripartite tricarboxylate transporter substrate binding protein [Betaproteobacteria bacterium]|nr:tripartite tricarboxylate transporter substrate binding protein [Betaproteobacteria bacterium]
MSFNPIRRRLAQAGASLAATAALPLAAQESRPPLRIIVPLPAGGVADTSVRFFADQWTAQTRQTVVVDNRPGGSFVVGVQQLLNAPPDGNTWLHLNNGMSAAQASFQRYDLTKQVATLGMIGTTPGALFVSASGPHRSVRELLDWIRAHPGKLSYGAVIGGVEHLTTAALLRRNGLSGTLIPFKGGPDACTALAQNEIELVVSALPLIVPFKGRIRPLAVLTDQRSPLTPEVPTFREIGLDTPELPYWGAFGVPAATPPATVAALHRGISEVVRHPGLIAKYAAQGMFASSSTPEAMNRVIAEEVKWMSPVAADLNLKAG